MVEIYFEKELSDIVFEAETLAEWKAINEELGLQGQIEFAHGTKSPIPFPFMNKKMQNICDILCPTRMDIKDYNKSPIPIEVLKQAKFTMNEQHFGRLSVLYDDKSPDPFLIGEVGYFEGYFKDANNNDIRVASEGKKEFSTYLEFQQASEIIRATCTGSKYREPSFYPKEKYLIARWGDQLRDFKELTKLAIERAKEEFTNKLKADLAKIQDKLATIESKIPLYISGDLSRWDLTSSF